MIVTLKAIYVNDKSQNGQPLSTKNGKPYWSVVLDTQEQGKLYNNIFNQDFIPHWQAGQQVNVEITQKGKYRNWDFPKPNASAGETPYNIQPENPVINSGAAGYIQKNNPMVSNPMETTYQNAQETFKKPQDPDAEGKVRHGVSIAFIERGAPFNEAIKKEISDWADFIMNGK